ncbi:hypothetical protein N825_25320 [Skermanella stibiiresistens SB22]|uniref:Uncharacterized protein n=1 Tax=Skermanella stibiiresistens SB22 TaxID=1385369 RepID=W9GWD7_9PROT|nr:hypothetical protein [Skermanella stibiiresistens]EWY36757.1 hypothetical protein N825_25320 [Skermanella stibiiresistens SB22]
MDDDLVGAQSGTGRRGTLLITLAPGFPAAEVALVEAVIRERGGQVTRHGRTPAHDDALYPAGSDDLLRAAVAYLAHEIDPAGGLTRALYPWDAGTFRPGQGSRNFEKGLALGLAAMGQRARRRDA